MAPIKVVIAFVLIVSVILVNLLVAQLNQAYQHVYTDMQGARWERWPGGGVPGTPEGLLFGFFRGN